MPRRSAQLGALCRRERLVELGCFGQALPLDADSGSAPEQQFGIGLFEWIVPDQEQFRAVLDGHEGVIDFRGSPSGGAGALRKVDKPKQFGSTDHSPSTERPPLRSAPRSKNPLACLAASPFGRRSRIPMKAAAPPITASSRTSATFSGTTLPVPNPNFSMKNRPSARSCHGGNELGL
jgi:hypothetical protein